MEHYDVAVIGGGPGGYVCAIRCSQEGLKTLLIEKEALGGTCLNAGCIPTKSLLQSAKIYRMAQGSEPFGVSCRDVSMDFGRVMRRKDQVVQKLRRGVESLVKNNGCTLMRGEASFADEHTLRVKNGEAETVIAFQHAVIATGSCPAELPIPGLDTVSWVNSDGFLRLDELPKRVILVGTGVIGMEFCTFLNAAGAEVTMLDMLPEILTGIDEEIAQSLRKIMQSRGVAFFQCVRILRFEKSGKDSVCIFEKDGKEQKAAADLIVLATGRRPNTEGLRCKETGLQTEKGFIPVDDTCRTNLPHIYAIGDVNGKAMLAHAASEQGMIAAHNISSGEKKKAEFSQIPSCIYTEPEIACIGLSAQKAAEKGLSVTVGRFGSAANGKSIIIGETDGFAKVVAEKHTGEILGVQLFCDHATDIIGEGVAALKLESTLTEIGDAIHPHPTVGEMLMEAVHDALGQSAHTIKR